METILLVLLPILSLVIPTVLSVKMAKKRNGEAERWRREPSAPPADRETATAPPPRPVETVPRKAPAPHTPGVTVNGGFEVTTIQDVLDPNLLQQVIDVFTRATGLASVVTDINGKPITTIDNFSDFCMKHTRGTVEGNKRCQENDARGGMEAAQTGNPVVYYCHAGLIDFAVPIIINGRQIGTWLGGQVLTAKPDEKKFRKIAREIGVDENEYIRDLRKIRIIPKEQIDAMADLLSLIANTLLQVEYARKVTEEKAGELSEMVIQAVNRLLAGIQGVSDPARRLEKMMAQATSALHQTADGAETGQTGLARMEQTMRDLEKASRTISGRLEEISERNHNISDIIGTITKVADQTNLLSLNAAIEAEKAGEYGRGFTVVAREIRRLADQTAVSTLGIERMVKEMQTAVSSGVRQTDGFIDEVRRTANDAVSVGTRMTTIIEQLRQLLPRFEEVRAAANEQTERTDELQQSMASLSADMQKTIDLVRRSFRMMGK